MSLRWFAALPVVAIAGPALWLLWSVRGYPAYEEKESGTYADHFVRIDASGAVHELTQDERDYLNTRFHGADGARPYIKDRYWERTPDGKLHGFLLRKRVPRGSPMLQR